ncbi:hypothetical protein M441DRAFT_52565 [Trichoderma asperellum CBS 433.97]|uniref:Uncharacterized protein n=1 Tax=Trichoderma asperellum (strain ATCC 204424 / CBS 433.97 / NBRC 101777) TaxID=1042311 RepID=A0A2T3YQY6_TRIA4|nr:hypothetical protein M441DRAFT_52565 [Trichoderma asperellum CBS 433.97]PTB34934.1 hypothetical protein M441DRAFT_52565 [Trichoderma asperellum CBS 433.97]
MEYRHSDKMPVSSADYFTGNNITMAALEDSDIPRLDSEKSMVTSGPPHAATPGSQSCMHQTSNDQTHCPKCNTFAFLDQLLPNAGGTGIDDNFNVFNNYTSTDDIKWMLMGISSRLDALETAVSTGNSRMDQLSSHIISLLGNIPSKEEFIHAIGDLKKNMKGFTKALLIQLFGCHVLGEVDTGDNP